MTQRVTRWIGLSSGDSSSGVIVSKVLPLLPQPLPLTHSPIAGPVLHRFPLLHLEHLGDLILYVVPFTLAVFPVRLRSCPKRLLISAAAQAPQVPASKQQAIVTIFFIYLLRPSIMRLLPATLLVGAASAAAPPMQQVMGIHRDQVEDLAQHGSNIVEDWAKQGASAFEEWTKKGSDAISKPFQKLKDDFSSLSDEARELWEEVANHFPNTMDHAPMLSLPKKHTRRPDSHWDHVIRGKDVQSIWVTGTDGTKEREIGGRLEAYDLRVKKVDPSALGVDPNVKQYSGYLDDNDNDKHLFYCKLATPLVTSCDLRSIVLTL